MGTGVMVACPRRLQLIQTRRVTALETSPANRNRSTIFSEGMLIVLPHLQTMRISDRSPAHCASVTYFPSAFPGIQPILAWLFMAV